MKSVLFVSVNLVRTWRLIRCITQWYQSNKTDLLTVEACLCVPGSLRPGFYVFATFMQLFLQHSLLQLFFETFWNVFCATFWATFLQLCWQLFCKKKLQLLATFFFGNKKLQRGCIKLQKKVAKKLQNWKNQLHKKLHNSCIKVAKKVANT